jgi:hypothetical protein
MGRLYGRAGRLAAENGGYRPGQCGQCVLLRQQGDLRDLAQRAAEGGPVDRRGQGGQAQGGRRAGGGGGGLLWLYLVSMRIRTESARF